MIKQKYGRHLLESPGGRKHRSWRRQTGSAWLWVMVAVALLGAMAGYGYYHPDVLPSWVRPWASKILDLPDPQVAKPLYRWHDEQGRMQITDTPPRGRPYEKVVYRKDVNVLPSGNTEDQ